MESNEISIYQIWSPYGMVKYFLGYEEMVPGKDGQEIWSGGTLYVFLQVFFFLNFSEKFEFNYFEGTEIK